MYRFLKRGLDFVFALLFIAVLSPFFLFISVLVFFQFGQSPLFFQERIGLKGAVFKIVKFKTLKNNSSNYSKLSLFFRKTSLDELPQFFNVLLGQMSLVGPRPLLVEYGPLYNELQKKRHDVLPGITGLVQVEGGNSLNWSQRFDLDLSYVESVSLKLDFLILCRTLKLLLSIKRVKIHQSEPFKGN